jgi:fumarate hydratase, class II
MMNVRKVKDSMGELEVMEDALYGAQTQRAVNNFPISGLKMPRGFIQAMGLIKSACAQANRDLGFMEPAVVSAIMEAADNVASGEHDEHFPIDVFQTGSGTSTNMNTNEVVARLASLSSGVEIHPNDHVNMCQSSNDVIPTAIHVSASLGLHSNLLPSLKHLASTLDKKAQSLQHITKTGRTHLMDAMPVTMGQELGAWSAQIKNGIQRIEASRARIQSLAIGGTAVGTGINAPEDFGARVSAQLTQKTGVEFSPNPNRFEGLSAQDAACEISGQLKVIATGMMKIANDLRWMNSGPLAGFGEIALPALQPGSSIMPGKVNPVIPEAVCMVAAQVIGNDATITVANQSGNFQLNVMLPVIAYNLLQSIEVLGNAARALADNAISGFTVNEDNIKTALERNPILVTALNTVIGYEKGAAIAKTAYKEGKSVREVTEAMTDLSKDELDRLLDPTSLTQGGIPK